MKAKTPKCARIQTSNPIDQVKTLPFNRYSWLTTHNSFAMLGTKSLITGSNIIFGTNQMDGVTAQPNVCIALSPLHSLPKS
ncbi:hypothetical protein GBA52_027263 [Prunus armeniaca]|nr:hypothetical protein GBA52_027263 [Prunus armeniaca]